MGLGSTGRWTLLKSGLVLWATNICLCLQIPSQDEWRPTPPEETAPIVTKELLQKIIPTFGLALVFEFGNGPASMAKTSQNLTKVLSINCKLHCAYTPQSSAQIERTYRTLKETEQTGPGN